MAKLTKNADKNNRKLTDFFVRTSSQIPSSPSQPPQSSQPGPSSSQLTRSSQTSKTPLRATQPRTVEVEKNLKLPAVEKEKEVISLSSDSTSDPIVISSDTTNSNEHISISSGSGSGSASKSKSKSVISPKKPKPSTSKSTSKPKQSTIGPSTTRKKTPRTIAVLPNPNPAPSTAKTTIKKRPTSTTTTSAHPPPPPRLNLPKSTRPIKRKCTWDTSSSEGEEDGEGEGEGDGEGRIYVPRPGGMPVERTRARVPRVLAQPDSPSSPTNALPTPSSPLTNLSTHSRSSKRMRLDTSPSDHDADADDSEELIPSSQSDEQELTLPTKKGTRKEKKKVCGRGEVDRWRRSSVHVGLSPTATRLPVEDVPATPPASSPAEGNWTSDPASPASPIPPLPLRDEDGDGDVRMDVDNVDLPEEKEKEEEDVSQIISERQVERHLTSTSSSTLPPPLPPAFTPKTPPPPRRPTPSIFSDPAADGLDFHPPTPPPSDEQPKARVAALTVEEKTALMIAKMKADAARVVSDEEEEEEGAHSFRELSSSSEDSDEDLIFNFRSKGKGRASTVHAKVSSPKAPSSSSSDIPPPATQTQRYALRRRSSPSSSTLQQPTALATSTQSQAPAASRKKVANPLDKLLREKKSAERRGGGEGGLKAAEAVLEGEKIGSSSKKGSKGKGKGSSGEKGKEKNGGSKKGKGRMQEEMDGEESTDEEEDEDGEGWADEEAAMRVARTFGGSSSSGRLGSAGEAGDEDNEHYDEGDNEDDREDAEGEETEHFAVSAATKLLEGDEGKKEAVHRILERDRKSWLGRRRRRVRRGVSLWDDGPSFSAVGDGLDGRGGGSGSGERTIPELVVGEGEGEGSGVLGFLRGVVASNDETKLARTLIPHLLTSLPQHTLLSLLPWLTSTLLSTSHELLTLRAQAVIESIARRSTSTTSKVEVSTLVVECLRAMGAKEDSLAACSSGTGKGKGKGKVVDVEVSVRRPSVLLRGYTVAKLLRIVEAFVKNDAVAIEDIPDLIVTLLLVGLDPSTSPSLRTQVAVLVDCLAGRIPSDSDMEPELCARLLKLVSGWSTMNQAFMLSILRGGSSQLGRISRWLGYCMLLGTSVPTTTREEYFTLPKLHPIIALLTPSPSTTHPASIFDVMKNAEREDFCELLECHVELLEVVLFDVEGYVREEKVQPVRSGSAGGSNMTFSPASPEKEKERPQSELEMIVELLEKMHGKINDARAGDLDRSKVKASLQYCWSRIHYQRGVALRSVLAGRPKNLKGYFPRPIQRLSTQVLRAAASN